ncbi:MAG: HEPN domain-containing protein [Anaerolineae bacterium]|nr:HEPN domain-containing protein [Anaerolineae bacterium]
MPNNPVQSDRNISPELEMALISLDKAKQDLVAVGKWLTDTEIADEILGFHIQQAIEKSFKSVLLRRMVDYPRTHNLRLLIDLCQANDIQVPTKFFKVDVFNRYAVQ